MKNVLFGLIAIVAYAVGLYVLFAEVAQYAPKTALVLGSVTFMLSLIPAMLAADLVADIRNAMRKP
jgi:hypothetical protein